MAFDPFVTPIDYVMLGGQRTPGIAEVSGVADERNIDERLGPGLAGSFPVYMGNKLIPFTIRIYLRTAQDWIDYATFKPVLDRPPYGKRPRALECWHPWLEDKKVKACLIRKAHAPDPIDDGQGHVVVVECIEWRQPKISLAKPEASGPAKPTDPVDAYIEKLTAQVQELSK